MISNSYIVHGFMTDKDKLNLRGYEVMVFAFLYGQANHCSVQQVVDHTALTRQGAKGVIDRLFEKNLLTRQINGQKWDYKANHKEVASLV